MLVTSGTKTILIGVMRSVLRRKNVKKRRERKYKVGINGETAFMATMS